MNRALVIIIAATVALLVGGANSLVRFYVDWLWFGSVGYDSIFRTMLLARSGMFLLGLILFWLLLVPNVLFARRIALRSIERLPLRIPQGETLEELLGSPVRIQPLVRLTWQAVLLGGLFIGVILGLAAAGRWDTALRFLAASPFDTPAPLFGHDLGFFVFQLPMIRFGAMWLFGALAATAVAVLTIYAVTLYLADPSLVRLRFMLIGRARPARTHALALLAALVLVLAGIIWLQGYEILYSARDQFYGAGYTDFFLRLPAIRVLAGTVVLAAILSLATILRSDYWLPIAGAALAGLVFIVGLVALPAVVQKVRVEPDELIREMPFLANSIRLTRLGFALDRIEEQVFPAQESVLPSEVQASRQTVANVRLWDPRPLRDTYNQIQSIRLYYNFDSVDVDRYELDGQVRQVMLGARELDPSRLPGQAETWVNRHLQFTHGYGAVMSPVNEITPEGLPTLFLKDIPPEGRLPLQQPEIYYGLRTDWYVIVRTGLPEFDYPRGDENVYTTYVGQQGIRIGSLFRRAILAWNFRQLNLLTSQYLQPDSLLLFRREVPARVRRIAPFLRLDRDPYLVVADGRLFWIVDAYTTTDRIPYAQPVVEQVTTPDPELVPGDLPPRLARRGRTFNYIRNSVKVVVDAYDGTTNFYATEPDEPILRTYQRIYPELVRPLADMPASLHAHLRYPEDLFRVQAEVFRTYHMKDPQVFYNREDLWEVATEAFADERVLMAPYYVIMRLPGEPQEEFLLMLPFTPAAKDNMIAWLAARSDGENYGKLVLFKFPKERLIYGPMQIEARIDQNPVISAQLTLWNQGGSRVIRGNLLVIPVGNSTLYVEPVYLQAEQGRLPELKRVVLATGNRLVMEPTLDEALDQLFGAEAVAVLQDGATDPALAGTDAAALIAQARAHYAQAQEALRTGQWATFGQELEALGRALGSIPPG